MPIVRAFRLSACKRALLAELWENRGTNKGELRHSVPEGWWLGNKQVNGALCMWLLRYSLLRISCTDSGNGNIGAYTIFVAGEETGRLLADPEYVPEGAALIEKAVYGSALGPE